MTQIEDLQAKFIDLGILYTTARLQRAELEDMEDIDQRLNQMWEKCRAEGDRLLNQEVDFSQLDRFVEQSLQVPDSPFPEIGFVEPFKRRYSCFFLAVKELKKLCMGHLAARRHVDLLPLLEKMQSHLESILAIENQYGQYRQKEGVKSENLESQLQHLIPTLEKMCSLIRDGEWIEFWGDAPTFLSHCQVMINSYDEIYPTVIGSYEDPILFAYARAGELYCDVCNTHLPKLQDVLSSFIMGSVTQLEDDLLQQSQYIERCDRMEELIEKRAEITAKIQQLRSQQASGEASCSGPSFFPREDEDSVSSQRRKRANL